MNSKIDAAIAALEVVFEQTENDGDYYKVMTANRWIMGLPDFQEKWQHLILEGDESGEVLSDEFLTHIRATIAYLQHMTNQSDDAAQPIEGEILDKDAAVPSSRRFKLLR